MLGVFVSGSMLNSSGHPLFPFFFFFNDTATTEIYTLSLHDALPILNGRVHATGATSLYPSECRAHPDRKSTRLNSSHANNSYAVFCLKKKKHSRSAAHRLGGHRLRLPESKTPPAAALPDVNGELARFIVRPRLEDIPEKSFFF